MPMHIGIGTMKDAFAEWFADRPIWKQTTAASCATTRRKAFQEDIRNLADLCIVETNGTPASFKTICHGIFGATTGEDFFKIRLPDKLVRANFFRGNSCLDFGTADFYAIFWMN